MYRYMFKKRKSENVIQTIIAIVTIGWIFIISTSGFFTRRAEEKAMVKYQECIKENSLISLNDEEYDSLIHNMKFEWILRDTTERTFILSAKLSDVSELKTHLQEWHNYDEISSYISDFLFNYLPSQKIIKLNKDNYEIISYAESRLMKKLEDKWENMKKQCTMN